MNTRTYTLLVVAIIAVVALIIAAVLLPRETAAGWLLALSYVAAFPLGSLALLMIHRLTGGHWGEALEPFIRPLALTTPLLLVLIIPVLIASPLLFPWHPASSNAITHSVRMIYLNVPAYAIRSLVAVTGWSVLAFILPAAESRSARLIAGVGLVFYGVAVTVVSLDWILAAQPLFFSTSFGASVAFTQLLAALALAAVFVPRNVDLPDIGALMLVVTLGITYTDFMAVLVMWYGDVPSKIFWFTERIAEPWLALAIAAFVITSLIPVFMLMFARVRSSRGALRFVGAFSLAGLAVYQTWLLAPAFGIATVGTALLALLAMASTIAAAISAGWLQHLSHRWGIAHGR